MGARSCRGRRVLQPVPVLSATFGATASTSVSGALAEPSKAPPRTPHISAAQLDAYFNYFAAIATFIYPWIVQMTWAYGWMSNLHLPDLPFEGPAPTAA